MYTQVPVIILYLLAIAALLFATFPCMIVKDKHKNKNSFLSNINKSFTPIVIIQH